ncbi:acyl-CoA dehydrogenase family protein [Amycolatopsis roodepoortensis]|uniref:Dibenzothiophene monooxygenase n=1 Tax=Amycolatopsis roodepoortensis TaxID=700274 RepID=A0ABR9LCA7_9PSEU|nr:acyl-CoA dehydrogenase family protein [Amycolatopsis roodepoortensis]MBE1578303.1 alkylation response protein AidB-like acyl-CoA dehydrogenase [Amycolatopsis roodepoortensis]
MTEVWRKAAHELASTLAADAAERDLAGRLPVHEVGLLRESGLLPLLDTAGWAAANEATRIVSAADASVGHLLGYHYLQLWRTGLFGPRAASEPGWFWAGVSNPLDAALLLTPADGGFTVDGTKTFATGAAVADRLVVSATRTDNGEKLTFVVDARADGITFPGEWDNIGQRLTASGAVRFEAVRVAEDDVLGAQPEDQSDPKVPRISLAAIGFQLMLAQVYVGLAFGALDAAAVYTRESARPWTLSDVDKAAQDPYILAGYGELVATARAAGFAVDAAVSALGEADDRGFELPPAERAEAAIAISSAKIVASRAAVETTSKIFEFTGARATATKYGFDRFWRNARTLTLHDPVTYKAREVGDHFLNGIPPCLSGYS